MKKFSLLNKINFFKNYYNIEDVLTTREYIIALTKFSTIVYSNHTKESRFIPEIFRKVYCENDILFGICPYNHIDEEIKIYNLLSLNKINSLTINLEKGKKIIHLSLEDNKLNIILTNGSIYEYDLDLQIMNTKLSLDIYSFTHVCKSVNSSETYILAESNYNKDLGADTKILMLDQHIFNTPFEIHNLKQDGVIDICCNNLFISIAISSCVIILKFSFIDAKKEIKTVAIIPINDIIKKIIFHPSLNNYLLVNCKSGSLLYLLGEYTNEFNLIEKFNYSNMDFNKKDGTIMEIKDKSIHFFKGNKHYEDYILEPLKKEKNKYESEQDLLRYTNNLSLYNQNKIPFDFVIKSDNVDYQKRIHAFVLYSKLNPGIIQKCNPQMKGFYDLDLTDIFPTHESIDEFIKYLYTNILPDANTIMKDIDFFCYISRTIIPLGQNSLFIWSNYIRNYCSLNLTI